MPFESSYLMLLYFQHRKKMREKQRLSTILSASSPASSPASSHTPNKESDISRASTVDLQVPEVLRVSQASQVSQLINT